ncbi:MAG: riboflavin biosynthesis protein RibD [Betaproteobacteria bacterium CG2_30_59_46]|nr:MAG: riboflavin biosynthesis protein RibD [Betaproteobacteria bacterium CG2_30_59_46]PIQ14171.1 MAG: riboflavin biosynthesis protein RibD [Hydrogenophilales bacterium CG18_big_fil_WC_8_21_14_2_50_58_12]PIY00850.1 MAG: riboflavin biosynthesis protein RibD [Hydrogenophilales bacterium CG_4_10_14_3_um_filter_58_23]PJB08818.1 MAG: riboflavin biosynthesis protein RibD [Hydrogenophilales bacterium CG_4_9_14_3_um_filter_59_35]
MFFAVDHEYMAQALRLAEKGLYTTTPNPRVGCVIVRDGKVVGSGWHERAGEPHAEIHALKQAGELARGATAYVTLEPCSHHGRTPPCAEALVQAGVGRVVVAMVDPNPLVAGEGLARLQQAGIQTDIGLLEKEAHELNIGFVSRMTCGRPWLRLKIAASLDGKTALNNGVSQWITGPDARRDAHRLRARSCALLTGIGTVLADDPSLNVREVETTRQPLRVVVDSALRMSPTAKMLGLGPTLVATVSGDPARADELRAAGAEVLVLPAVEGRVDLVRLLDELGRRCINEVMVEAGATLNGALVKQELVDEYTFYFAPLLLGHRARGMFDLPELSSMGERRELRIADVAMVGRDLRIRALPVN